MLSLTTTEERNVRVIEPQSGWRVVNLGELWAYRDLLYFLTWRDVKVRYKQTVLGATWAILQPVMTMIVFSVFFGRLGGIDQRVEGPYPLFVYAGILPWTFFASAVVQSALSLISNAQLVTKVYFPRLIVPVSAILAATVDFGVSLAVMFGLMAWYGVAPSAACWLLPMLMVLLIAVAIGVGTFLAALVVSYRDFRYVVPFVMQIWMFASPVIYPPSWVDESWRWLYALNPLVGVIEGFRAALLGYPLDLPTLGLSLLSTALLVVVGIGYFGHVERRFSDIV